MSEPSSDIGDPGLAPGGSERIELAWREMPVLRGLDRRFSE